MSTIELVNLLITESQLSNSIDKCSIIMILFPQDIQWSWAYNRKSISQENSLYKGYLLN